MSTRIRSRNGFFNHCRQALTRGFMKKRERGQQPAQAPMSFVEVLEARIAPAVFTSLSGTVLTISSDNAADVIELRVDSSGGATDDQIQIAINSGGFTNDLDPAGGTQTLTVSAATRIDVNLGGGNDLFAINHAGSTGTGRFFGNGFAGVGLPVNLDGGGGTDTLEQTGNPGANLSSDTYTVGPDAGAGTHYLINGPSTKGLLVSFQNLAPVLDFVPGPLTVNANNASNAINFAGNVISVDGFETIQILNKTNVTINALAGDDTININNPTGLSGSVTVNGGDPTASDTVIVNGTAGVDTVNIGSFTADGATITGLSSTIILTTTEHLIYNGQGGADALTITTPAGGDSISFTPGATANSANIDIRRFAGFGGGLLVPVNYTNIDAGGSLSFADAGGTRLDDLNIYGTAASDQFNVAAATGAVTFTKIANGFTTFAALAITTPGVTDLILYGNDGDDTFNIAAAQPYASITLDGGNTTASDTVNLSGAAGAIALSLASQTITGYGGSIGLLGVEALNLGATGGAATLTITGTSGPESLTYIPTSATGGNVADAGLNLAVTFSGVAGAFTIDPLGGNDTITVVGTNAGETIGVDASVGTVTVGAFKTLTFSTANTDSLIVQGLAGSDIFNVTAGSVPVLIDGGDPIGLPPGDHINISGASTYNAGPLVDQGSFSGPNQPVSFVHIESITVLGGGGGGPAIINGTNGNDAITIIARDGSYDAAANGVRDFTASVNVGPEVLFINFAALQVNALSGDDVIDLQAPAPNGAVWDVAVTIDGGAPGGSDKLIVETPGSGAETVNYTPNATNGGVLDITSITSPITITDVEQLVYEGRGDSDVITIFGTVGDDTIVATPGAVFDSGAIQVNNLLAFNYQNIGGTASLTVNAGAGRNDTLVVNGTAASDTFGVSAAGVVTLNANRPFNTAGVENVTLEGYAGDDTFNIAFGHPFTSILVDGGDPSYSDIVNLTGDGTTVTAAIGGATQTVSGGGLGSVNLTGVEIANINAAGGNLTLQGTASDDTISITPLGLNNGTAQANNISPVVNFSNTGTLTADLLGGNDKLAVNGGATADTFTLTGSTVSLTTLGGPRESVVYANAEQVTINGLDGADSLTVDSTGGAVSLPGGVLFDGGAANDSLTLIGGTAVSDTYAAGPNPGSGTSTIVFAGPITQVVNFQNIEPVIDLIAGPLTVLGNAANNAINYSVGSNATRGLVTIDTQESIEFSNKTALTINAGAGSDTINLNNPNTPTGFTGIITVNGGDPATDSDTLLINGVAATVTVAEATSTITGASGTGGATGISYTAIEHLSVAAGTSSSLAVTGSANYIYTAGVAFDAGTIATDFLPISLSGYGAGKTLSVTGIGAADNLIVNGTSNDDVFTVAAGTGAVSLQNRATIAGTGIENLTLQGMDGSDTFNVTGPQSYNTIAISGGNTGSDVANLTGDGTALTAAIGGPATTVTGAGLAVVSMSLTDVANVNVNAGVGAINVNGTSGPNAITVTPNGTFTSAITVAGSTSELDTNNTGLLTINEGTPGDGDLLTINGTTANDLIAVTRGADTTVLVNALKLVHVNAANIEALVIAAGLGDDTVTVSGSGGPALTVDAGAPNASDTLVVAGAAGAANVFTVTPGTTNDSGSVTLGVDVTQFIGVEKVTLDGGGGAGADIATILGNGSSNAVAVNAVSASSMTVGIDTRALVTVANFSAGSTLNVNPGDGDDTVSVNPSGASNFTINVDEGGPVGSDTLVVEGTVLADAIGYTPSATVPADGVIVVNSVTTNFFGSEAVTINGLGGTDTFTANGLATDDSIVVTPAGNLGGTLKINGSTPVNFANMENVTIDAQAGRNDTITFNATINNDTAGITGTSVTLNGQLFTLANNENIVANLGDGDDTVTVAGAAGVAIAVNGGDPSASDKLTYNGAGAAITFDFGAQTITEAGLGAVTITGIEVANVNAVAAAIAVNGTSGPDVIEVTPTTANTATIHVIGLAPTLNTNNTSTLTIAEGTAGDGDEVLVDGTVGSDTIGIVRGADTTVTVNALKGVHLTSANVESLVVAAAYGNDTINVSGSGGPALSVDGGLNTTSDILTITNTAGGTTTVTPGTSNDSGFVENTDGSVSFAAIESLKINGTGVGDTLVVLGTDDTDQMALQNVAGVNRATLNHQVPVNFASFGTVTLDGGFGDDKISVSPVGLTTVTMINVIGGDPTASDQLIVNGTAAADTFTFAPTGGDSGAITITGAPVVNYTTVETTVLSGLAGDDIFKIGAATGNVKIVGSTGSDTIDFSASTSGVTFDMDLVNQIQRVGLGDETVTIGDPMENFMGSSFNDFVHAAAMPFARTINGGAPLGLAGNTPATPVPPGDKLVIDAKNENITTVNVAGTGSVTPFSYAPINFVSIETLRIENAASGGPGSGGGSGGGGVFNDHSYTLSVHYPTGKQPTSVATGDVNGDGRPDIVETDGKSNSIAVLLNNGNGTFASAVNYSLGPLAKSSNAVVLGDFDGNGTLDAAVANKKSNNVSIMTNTGGGIFALASTISMGAAGKTPLTLAVGNLNAGGDLDLVVANQQSNKLSVLLGGAGMSFGAPTAFATGGINLVDVKLADINGDGILDAVTANEQSRNISLLMGTGTGTFTAPFLFAAGNDPAALVAGDLNGDGKADVAVANGGSGYATILINNGLGGFLPQAQAHYKEAQLPATMMLADVSNDGKLDLITVNKNTHNMSVLLGVGNGTFDTQVDFAIGVPQDKTPAMLGLADFNGDGSLDAVVANSGTNFAGSVGLSVLLKNPTP